MNGYAYFRLLALGLAACAVPAVTGCSSGSSGSGGSGGPAKEPAAAALESSMQKSVRQASSVHIDGQVVSNKLPVTVDIGVHRKGGMAGTISQNGAKFQVLGVDGKVYVKATPQFLKQVKAPSNACAIVCGRWIELSSQQASQLGSELSMQDLTGDVGSAKKAELTEEGTTTVRGQPAWVLRAADGAVVYVSSVGKPYPLEAKAGSGKNDAIYYSQWSAVSTPALPPASQVLNLSGLH
jgi:hypothetical protein